MRRRSSQCLLPRESVPRATTRSIRRPKPCSQSREAARMRARRNRHFQSLHGVASFMLPALCAHCLTLPTFMHGSFRPKIITLIILSLLFLRKCHFTTKMAKTGHNLLSFPTKKALTPEGSHVRHMSKERGRIYEPSEENPGRSREVSFCAWNARLAHSDLSPSPLRKRCARWIPEARLVASI